MKRQLARTRTDTSNCNSMEARFGPKKVFQLEIGTFETGSMYDFLGQL